MHHPGSLVRDLHNLGIRPDDRILVHSSMKAIGAVDGGPDAVLDALIQTVRDGLLLLPTHTWQEWNNRDGVFDPQTEPSCVGHLTERFRTRPGVIRSWHPTHSIAGLGAGAAPFLAGEENTRSPCPREGCWGRLHDIAARIVFLGAPLRTNTFLHSVEEWYAIPDRLAVQATLFRIRRPDGTLIDCPQHRHASSLGDVSRFYDKIEADLLRLGAAREGRVGDARCVVCEVPAMARFAGSRLERDPHFFAYR